MNNDSFLSLHWSIPEIFVECGIEAWDGLRC